MVDPRDTLMEGVADQKLGERTSITRVLVAATKDAIFNGRGPKYDMIDIVSWAERVSEIGEHHHVPRIGPAENKNKLLTTSCWRERVQGAQDGS